MWGILRKSVEKLHFFKIEEKYRALLVKGSFVVLTAARNIL
jgi:hypothetical protein